MTDKEVRLRRIVGDFEDRKIDGQVAIDRIKQLTGETIDIGYLTEYWSSESLDTFVEKLLVEHIIDWQKIDDKKAIELIIEMQNSETREGILLRNSTALERRYGKSTGTVINKIFDDYNQDPELILKELKKDTRIYL